MIVYHRTDHADAIERDGFRDGEGRYMTTNVYQGVWVAAPWPLDENEGAGTGTVLELDIPERLFTKYEWVEQGKTYREALIPAAELTLHLASLRRLSDEDVDALEDARWRSFHPET